MVLCQQRVCLSIVSVTLLLCVVAACGAESSGPADGGANAGADVAAGMDTQLVADGGGADTQPKDTLPIDAGLGGSHNLAAAARFQEPHGVAIDSADVLWWPTPTTTGLDA